MKKLVTALLIFIMAGVSLFGMFACDRGGENEWWNFNPSGDDCWLINTYFYDNIFGVSVGAALIGKPAQKTMGAGDAFMEEFETELKKLEAQCSTSIATSDVARFNAAATGEKIYIGEYTKKMYDLSKQIWEESDAFNPAALNFVDYWGFAPLGAAIINPGDIWGEYPPQIASDYGLSPYPLDTPENLIPILKQVSDFADVKCDYDSTEGKWYLQKLAQNVSHTFQGITTTYTLRIDFGGVAKGYAADIGAELANKYAITKGYIDVNSSKYLLKNGNQPGESSSVENGFQVSVRDPRHNEWDFFAPATCGTITTEQKNLGLSTSADSEKYYNYPYENEGLNTTNRYCHIIDPLSGWPINVNHDTQSAGFGKNYQEGIISVTLLHESAALTDAYATVAMVMASGGGANIQAAFDWLESTGTIAVIIVQFLAGGGVPSFKVKCINLANSEFEIDSSFLSTYSFYE